LDYKSIIKKRLDEFPQDIGWATIPFCLAVERGTDTRSDPDGHVRIELWGGWHRSPRLMVVIVSRMLYDVQQVKQQTFSRSP
jgi:hypothetical protein